MKRTILISFLVSIAANIAYAGLARVPVNDSGVLVVYSTSPGSVAMDGDQRNGLFTASLLKVLSEPDQDITSALSRVSEEVRAKSNGHQIPWSIKLQVEGKYAATPRPESEAPKGHYLPDVYVNVTECKVNFPCSASGSANLSNPSNIGRDSVNAEVKVHGKLNAGWFAQHMGITIGFEATGTGGFRLIGKE